MGLIRLLFWIFLFYFGYKLLANIIHSLSRPKQQDKVREQKQGKPSLDLKDEDVEDADFREIK